MSASGPPSLKLTAASQQLYCPYSRTEQKRNFESSAKFGIEYFPNSLHDQRFAFLA